MNNSMKIACYGYVEKDHGSLRGANFLILEELLLKGYEIDFYNHQDFIYPSELLAYKKFKYIDIKQSSLYYSLKALPNFIDNVISPLFITVLISQLNANKIKQNIASNHEWRNYDLLLFLGCYSKFRIRDIPSVTWVQGPPQTEKYFNLYKLWREIIKINGVALYIKLLVFYTFKSIFALPKLKVHDLLICGSKWSKKKLADYGFLPKRIHTLPYPIDFKLFEAPKDRCKSSSINTTTFLWIGRCDPRKRLDLVLEAFTLLLEERHDVKLKIFGKFRYAKGYKKLVDDFKFADFLEYEPYIDRLEIPKLMSKCSFLIQPSEGENFGSSVAEAMCCGLPVIVGPTNGTKDYISSSSFVFEQYTAQSLFETMLKAANTTSEEREIMALDARKAAEKNFDVSNITISLEEIFDRAVNLKSNH